MSTSRIENDKVVTIHYTLRNDAGEELDSSAGEEPMAYLHGAENIVPGLERALAGKAAGDVVDVVIEAKDGYGERQGPEPQPIARSSFPPDVQEGMQFVAEGEDGLFPLWVSRIEGDKVFVDTNHPLAGERLHFHVEVVGMRDATDEELSHGHPHGPGGHHHH